MCGDCGECSPRPLSPRRHLSWAHSLRPPTPCARLRDAARSAAAAGSREGWARSGRRVLCFAAAAVAGERWAGSQDPERGGRAAGAQRAETPAGPGAGEGGPGGRMGQAAGSGSQNPVPRQEESAGSRAARLGHWDPRAGGPAGKGGKRGLQAEGWIANGGGAGQGCPEGWRRAVQTVRRFPQGCASWYWGEGLASAPFWVRGPSFSRIDCGLVLTESSFQALNASAFHS